MAMSTHRIHLGFCCWLTAGGLLSACFLSQINLQYTPPMIAAGTLYRAWGTELQFDIPQRFEFSGIGLFQTAISMLVATTGPMGMAALARRGFERDELVVNSAVMMCAGAIPGDWSEPEYVTGFTAGF